MTNKGRSAVLENHPQKLLNATEAAEYLGLKPKWGFQQVQKWVREGKLRAGRAGDLYRFRIEDLDDFVFSRK